MRRMLPKGIHSHLLQRLIDPLPDLLRHNAQILRGKRHILLHHIGHDLVVRILEHHPDGFTDLEQLLFLRGVDPKDPDLSPARQ